MAASNLISAKRTNLDTKLAGQKLFLKRNIKTMKVFAPDQMGRKRNELY